MIHAILLVLVGALFRKLGIRDLTPQEERALPSYYVTAERVQRWVGGIVFAVLTAVVIAVGIGEKLGW